MGMGSRPAGRRMRTSRGCGTCSPLSTSSNRPASPRPSLRRAGESCQPQLRDDLNILAVSVLSAGRRYMQAMHVLRRVPESPPRPAPG